MSASTESTLGFFVLTDRSEADDAAMLIADFGAQAGRAAARQASACRKNGNVGNFCRWQRIGRLVDLMAGTAAGPTCH